MAQPRQLIRVRPALSVTVKSAVEVEEVNLIRSCEEIRRAACESPLRDQAFGVHVK